MTMRRILTPFSSQVRDVTINLIIEVSVQGGYQVTNEYSSPGCS